MSRGGLALKGVSAVVAVVAVLIVGPAAASAASFPVDDQDDVADAAIDGVCDATGGDGCTLRAAIQESNASAGLADTISFSSTPFNGEVADVINVEGSDLPAITDPVAIQCQSAPATTPCVQIDSPPGLSGLTVSADDVSIHGVAVTNALQGIAVFADELSEEISGFDLEHSWLGITLGSSDGSNGTGLFLDPSVQEAAIGGSVEDDRNVFGFNFAVGLRINGADDTTIQGNYFGVLANGDVQAPGQAFAIKLGGADLNPTDDPAHGTLIGGELSPAEEASAACDGPCNVISGSSGDGIDLGANQALGQIPAGGTRIFGNYIGLSQDASLAIANTGAGVDIGGAGGTESVDVGGSTSPFGNYITGGSVGVVASAGALAAVRSNRIGVRFDQTQVLSPPPIGVAFTSPADSQASANENRIATSSADAITVVGGLGFEADENQIGIGPANEDLGVGGAGIRLVSSAAPSMEGNVIAGAGGDGIVLDGVSDGEVFDNEVGLAGLGNAGAGVLLANGSTGNVVGLESPGPFPNVFTDNGGDAVAIVGATSTGNDVLRNTGSGNGGLFIDLGNDGPGATTGANGDIEAPVLTAVAPTFARGTAAPGNTVRVYAKSSGAPGELGAFIGSDIAGANGNWEVIYLSLTPPDLVGVAQTGGPEGTSELRIAPRDESAPQTRIKRKPKRKSTRRRVRITFKSSEPGSTFECKLDRKPFKPCTSPFRKKVKPGTHRFKVRATDLAGNTDPSPANARFKVIRG